MNLNERKLKSLKFFEQLENTKDHAIKKSILLYNSYHWNSYTCYINMAVLETAFTFFLEEVFFG